jgi:hypothetical protein
MGDGSDSPAVQSYLSQPRVRPQDIQLTDEDLQRQRRRTHSEQVAHELRGHGAVEKGTTLSVIVAMFVLVLLGLVMFAALL